LGGTGDEYLGGSRGPDLLLPGPGSDAVYAGGGDDRIRARGGAIDEVACGAGRDRATPDGLDFIARNRDPFYGCCERVFRTGTPAPVALGISAFNQSDALSVIVGCPADLGRRCRGRVRARIARRDTVKSFSFAAGQRGYVIVGPSGALRTGTRQSHRARPRPSRRRPRRHPHAAARPGRVGVPWRSPTGSPARSR
jgi:hypothetical protein